MPMMDAIKDMQNETAWQAAKDYAKMVQDSAKNGGRNVGGEMGKNDFLMLLSAQLRHQDPLNPQSDGEFASQLAQFSSLEQMQNMNSSLSSMLHYQSYSLVGKFVMAEAYIDGSFGELAGVVESVFLKDGTMHAQIGEYVVPVSSIQEVFDTNDMLTTEMFMQTANQLIGRTVVATADNDEEIEGLVTRIVVDKGAMYAQIDDGTDEPKFVPVNTIVDIRETGTSRFKNKPAFPPDAMNFKPDAENGGYIEYDAEDLVTPIGRWDWDADDWEWKYTSFAAAPAESAEDDEDPADDGDPDAVGGTDPIDDPDLIDN